jgi:hypothetical protein
MNCSSLLMVQNASDMVGSCHLVTFNFQFDFLCCESFDVIICVVFGSPGMSFAGYIDIVHQFGSSNVSQVQCGTLLSCVYGCSVHKHDSHVCCVYIWAIEIVYVCYVFNAETDRV